MYAAVLRFKPLRHADARLRGSLRGAATSLGTEVVLTAKNRIERVFEPETLANTGFLLSAAAPGSLSGACFSNPVHYTTYGD